MVLVLIDLTLIAINVLAVFALKAALITNVPDLLKVTHDQSLPEDYNYLKWAVIAIALLWLSIRDRRIAPALWAAVFVMILADDAFQLHERLGHDISVETGLPSNSLLYSDDLGELLVFAVMGLVVVALVLASLSRDGQVARTLSMRYLAIIGALAFFGVGVDAIHQIVIHLAEGSWLETTAPQITGLLEDGGEMVVGSVALAITLAADPLPSKLSPPS